MTGRGEAFEWPDDPPSPGPKAGKDADFPPVDADPGAGRMARRSGETRRLCALCARPFDHDDTRPASFFPFCSSRCRAVDLGNWVNGAYVVGGTPGSAELEDEPSRRRGGEADDDEDSDDEDGDDGTHGDETHDDETHDDGTHDD